MNTRISYLYRDAGNYKQFHDVVVSGELSEAERDQLWGCLDIDNGFIPEYVGLEPLQPRFEGGMTSDDHPWHEITSIDTVADTVTLQVLAKDLLQSFIGQADQWDFLIFRQWWRCVGSGSSRRGGVLLWHPDKIAAASASYRVKGE